MGTIVFLKFLFFLKRGLHFHFALDSDNYVARVVQIVISAMKEMKQRKTGIISHKVTLERNKKKTKTKTPF